jgi:outer membrane protein assembly factor BamB
MPHDAVSLQWEGVSLLPPVDDADVVSWFDGWLTALKLFTVDKGPTAQVSLETPAIEVCLLRGPGLSVELSVVSLAPEPSLVTKPVILELAELRRSLEAATRTFLRNASAAEVGAETLVRLERTLKEATSRAISAWTPSDAAPWVMTLTAGALTLTIEDHDGRTLLVSKGSGSLAALMTRGTLTKEGVTVSEEPPFLAVLAAVRRRPSKEAYELGLALCAALHQRHPSWASNPWVEALFVRCTEGLAAIRQPRPDLEPRRVPRPPPSRPELPLAPVGQPRRVTLKPKWSRQAALGEARGHLTLSKKAIVVHAAHSAQVFSVGGKEWRRVYSNRGVASTGDGTILTASDERLTAYRGHERSAIWIRHDSGFRIGPDLVSVKHLLLTRIGGRGVMALEHLTGREAWRFDPPRTQKTTFAIIDDRLVVGTDGGDLYGLDVADGQVRYRIRGILPCQWPVESIQRDAVAVLTHATQTLVIRFAAVAGGSSSQAGAVAWNRALPLELASRAVVSRTRIFLAGRLDNRGAVVCLSRTGEVLWTRNVPLDGASSSLVAFERGIIATDNRGAAVRLLPDGTVAWVLGGVPEALHARIRPMMTRQTLVVPGTSVRLVDPVSGRVLAATPPQPETADIAVGKGLTIFTYVEAGLLTCFEPRTILSVVD